MAAGLTYDCVNIRKNVQAGNSLPIQTIIRATESTDAVRNLEFIHVNEDKWEYNCKLEYIVLENGSSAGLSVKKTLPHNVLSFWI